MPFTRNVFRLVMTSPLVAALACDQSADRVTSVDGIRPTVPAQSPRDVVPSKNVASVEDLYAVVNDSTNAGLAIVLAPGTYVLSAKNAANVARPNGGRLELQANMSLYGVTNDRSAVIIDATTLPASSFTVSFGRTGPVRIGRGDNAVEWLTVLGNPAAAAGIAVELTGTQSTRIRVAHVVSSGASRGIDIRNAGVTMIGRRIEAEVVDNELIGPVTVQGMSEGIRVANFVDADQGVIVARLSGNRAHGYQFGCIFANNRSSHAIVEVRSSGDRFFGNTCGCLVAGGLNQSSTGFANWNSTTFEAHGSEFADNTATIAAIDSGGIRVVAGKSPMAANSTSHNTVSVSLWGSKVSGNYEPNFAAFGAQGDALLGLAGIDNHATVTLHGVSKRIVVAATASVPADPGGTNTVTVVR